MAVELEDSLDALGLPEEEEQETSETAQDTSDSGAETAAGGDAQADDGSDTGEEDSGAQAPAEPTVSDLLAKLDQVERANKGIYSDLQSERDRRRQLMEEIKKRADEEAGAKKRAAADAAMPDKEEDPAGYLQAQNERLAAQVNERLERMERARHEEAERDAYRQAEQAVNHDEARFVDQNPGYYDALNFARGERVRLLRATHPDQSDEWVQGMIQQGDRIFALQSLQQGVSPAQRAYDYAVRLGYQPTNGTQQGASEAGGAHTPGRAGSTPAPATKQRPQQTSLSGVQGKAGGRGRRIDMAAAVAADDQTFDQLFEPGSQTARELSEQGWTYY